MAREKVVDVPLSVAILAIGLVILCTVAITVWAQEKTEVSNFADVSVIPGQTIVIVRDAQGADQAVVTTFYWQTVPGIEKPIMRNVTAVVPVVKDTAVGADGAPNPKDVAMVHVSLVKVTNRLEWKPTTPVTPATQTP